MTGSVSAKGLPRAPNVKVTVTNDLIESAMRSNSGHCMTADALKQAFPGAINVAVDIQTIRFSDRERRLRYVYLTPRAVQIAIVDWDDGIEVEPFEFYLRGGSVTQMGVHVVNRNALDSASTRNDREAVLQKHRKRLAKYKNRLPKKAILRPSVNDGSAKLEIVGGQEPPISRFSLRREFGLRGFKRPGTRLTNPVEGKQQSPQR